MFHIKANVKWSLEKKVVSNKWLHCNIFSDIWQKVFVLQAFNDGDNEQETASSLYGSLHSMIILLPVKTNELQCKPGFHYLAILLNIAYVFV